MPDTDTVTIAKQIQRETGPTFHIATRFLPKRVRYPTYVLYAYFRKADQIVDDPDPRPPAEQLAVLTEYERAALGEIPTDDPVLAAMASLADEHDLDERDIEAFIEAMKRDIHASDYASYDDLETYLRGSAVAVAYMMLQVMAPEATHARANARALGEAFQLTNFLRDVREDVLDYDRVYLPTDTLQAHGIDADTIRSLEFSPAVADAIEVEMERTEMRYRTGVAGIDALPKDSQFPVLLASVLYAEYHRLIADNGYDVLSERPSLSKARYLRLVLRTWVEWKRHGDPETVFYRISTIDPLEEAPPAGQLKLIRRLLRPVNRVSQGVTSLLSLTRSE